MTAIDYSRQMTELQRTRPRPLAKLYGTKGPTSEQAIAYAESVKVWNKAYRLASKNQKQQLVIDNAAFHAARA